MSNGPLTGHSGYDARQIQCWIELLRARIALATARSRLADGERAPVEASLEATGAAVEEGLRIAREVGYGIYHIDLLLERAAWHLMRGDFRAATADVKTALQDGVHPPTESGLPTLIAATDEECNYACIAQGTQLLAEALLLQAAQLLGSQSFLLESSDASPEARRLIERAKAKLEECARFRKAIEDPRLGETEQALEALRRGILTRHPLSATTAQQTEAPAESAAASIFISYAHLDNQSADPQRRWLDRLLEHLTPLIRQEGLAVWSDRRMKTGDRWHEEIRRQLQRAKAAVLLISPAFLASEYIASDELPMLLKKAHGEGLKIMPVLISPSLFQRVRFRYDHPTDGPQEYLLSSLQAANTPSETLSELDEAGQNRVFVKLAEDLLDIVQGRAP